MLWTKSELTTVYLSPNTDSRPQSNISKIDRKNDDKQLQIWNSTVETQTKLSKISRNTNVINEDLLREIYSSRTNNKVNDSLLLSPIQNI